MKDGLALNLDLEMKTVVCDGCGAVFAIDASRYRRFRQDDESVRCPNPRCSWPSFHLTESEVQRLRKEVAAEKARADRAAEARRWAEESAEREKRRHAATKGKLTKTRKRVALGLCPCCRKGFDDLRLHMEAAHPEYAGPLPEGEETP